MRLRGYSGSSSERGESDGYRPAWTKESVRADSAITTALLALTEELFMAVAPELLFEDEEIVPLKIRAAKVVELTLNKEPSRRPYHQPYQARELWTIVDGVWRHVISYS